MKAKINIGISSLILIFLILCMAVFGLLSMSDAKSALVMAERKALYAQNYYIADTHAQEFISDYRNGVYDPDHLKTESGWITEDVITELKDGNIKYETPVGEDQTLCVEITRDGTQILSYYVYNNEEYEINTKLPVFGG